MIGLLVVLDTANLRRLRAGVGETELVIIDENIGDPGQLARCEIAFGNPPAAWLPQAGALRWVQLESGRRTPAIGPPFVEMPEHHSFTTHRWRQRRRTGPESRCVPAQSGSPSSWPGT